MKSGNKLANSDLGYVVTRFRAHWDLEVPRLPPVPFVDSETVDRAVYGHLVKRVTNLKIPFTEDPRTSRYPRPRVCSPCGLRLAGFCFV